MSIWGDFPENRDVDLARWFCLLEGTGFGVALLGDRIFGGLPHFDLLSLSQNQIVSNSLESRWTLLSRKIHLNKMGHPEAQPRHQF